MALANMGAGFTLVAKDLASPVLGRVGNNFMRMGSRVEKTSAGMAAGFQAMAVGMGALKIGTGITGAVGAAAEAAGGFQQGIAAIGVISGATSDELNQLHDAAINAALGTKFSPDEAVEGLTNLATAGQTAQEQMSTLIPVLDLATGSLGQLGLGEASAAVVGTLKAFGEGADQAAVTTDKLLKITQMTNFQARDFGVGLSRAATSAALYKQSLDDTLIAMGLLRNMNIEASVASTGLRESFARLATDERTQQLLAKKGVKVFDERTKAVRPFLDVMGDLAVKLKDAKDAEAFLTTTLGFGRRGMAAFNAVANAQKTIMVNGREVSLKGAQAIEAMRFEIAKYDTDQQRAEAATKLSTATLREWGKTAKGSKGAALEFREALLDTAQGQKELLQGSIETLKTVVGEGALPIMKVIRMALFNVTSAITNLLNAMPPSVRTAILGVFGAIGGIVASAGAFLVLKGIFVVLGLSITGLALSFLKLALVMAPITLLFAGLAVSAFAAFKAITKGTGLAADSWSNFVDKVKLGFTAITELWTSGALSSETTKELEKVENQGLMPILESFNRFLNRAEAFWEGLKAGFDVGVEGLTEPMRELRQAVAELFGRDGETLTGPIGEWKTAGQEVGATLGGLGEIMLRVFTGAIKLMTELKGQMKGVSAGDVVSGILKVVSVFTTLWNVIKFIKNAVMTVIDLVVLSTNIWVEMFGSIVQGAMTAFGVIKKLATLDFSGAMETAKSGFRGIVESFKGGGILSSVERISTRFGGPDLDAVRGGLEGVQDFAGPTKSSEEILGDTVAKLGRLRREREGVLEAAAARGGSGMDPELMLSALERIDKGIATLSKKRDEIKVEVDGETLFNIMQQRDREGLERSMGSEALEEV